jgi:flagellar biosynthesis anti-sigma factor FlgM
MRVGDNNIRETGAARAESSGGVSRAPAQPEGAYQAAADQVQLSRLARHVAESLATSETVHAARVAHLRNEYQAGRYQVDVAALSRKIADEILAETSSQPPG